MFLQFPAGSHHETKGLILKTVLITGANRGLGLEFTKQYLADGWRILACCRNPQGADALRALESDRLQIYALDVVDPNSLAAVSQQIQHETIDILINNAGIYGARLAFGELDYDVWEQVMRTNALAPIRLTESLVNLLAPQAKLIFITSKMGSIADNTSGGSYIYRSSKAALNAAVKSIALDLAGRGKVTALLHPGWVKTDMGGPHALITVGESVSGMRQVIANLSHEQIARFFNYDGKEIPW